METRTSVTPRQAVEHVTELIRAGQDQQAIDYWQDVRHAVQDVMTAEEFFTMCEAMHTASMAVDLEAAARRRTDAAAS